MSYDASAAPFDTAIHKSYGTLYCRHSARIYHTVPSPVILIVIFLLLHCILSR
jgi:hypothetical protein